MSETFQLFDALPAHIEDALRASIERFGVLVPVTVDQNGVMLDGHHRARIADALGVPYDRLVRHCEDDDERREIAHTLNADRRQLTDEQRRTVAAALFSAGHSERAVAAVVDISAATAHRLKDELTASGEAVLPASTVGLDGRKQPARRPQVFARDDREQERAQAALEAMPPSPTQPVGSLSVVEARQAVARQRSPESVPQPVPPPKGKYRCIILDPPWPMQKIERDTHPEQGIALDYPVMSLQDIADEAHVPVRTLAADDCHIYLWVTHKYLPAGMDLLKEWGFNYQCVMTWRKNVGFTPFSWMYDTEHVLFGRRGNLPLLQMGLRLSFEAQVKGHSVKPDVFYERVLQASPGPRVEMFSRRQRDGFVPWGNEVPSVV